MRILMMISLSVQSYLQQTLLISTRIPPSTAATTAAATLICDEEDLQFELREFTGENRRTVRCDKKIGSNLFIVGKFCKKMYM